MSLWQGRAALAVDDNEDSRKLAVLMLKKQGLEVAVAGDGAQALAHVRQQPCDLVLMDLEMPIMGGLDAMRAIRALEPARPVKLVALSAHADEKVKSDCVAAGADAYLVKPVRMADLVALLERLTP
jgi:CheY-like chemotaxis protein